jgi:hypothetical protein
MLKLNYNSKVATSRNVGKKKLGERLRDLKINRGFYGEIVVSIEERHQKDL